MTASGHKAIVAGTRTVRDYRLVASVMDDVQRNQGYGVAEVVSGGARGVDTLAEHWASTQRVPIRRFVADWATYGRRAGPRRNAEMASYGDLLIAIWDGKSRGTADMICKARHAGLPVLVYDSQSGALRAS